MNPKEKALDLFEKLEMLTDSYSNQRLCAIIVANEVLMCDAINHANNKETVAEKEYWKEVKSEIEKL